MIGDRPARRPRALREAREVRSMSVCPACEGEVELDEYDVDKGEIISCPECGVDLMVVGLAPLELDPVPPEENEWEE